jgi:hypothetical protein
MDLFALQPHVYWRACIANLIKLLVATTIYIASNVRLFINWAQQDDSSDKTLGGGGGVPGLNLD